MKRILLLLALAVSMTLADTDQSLPVPKGCVHNGNVVKCPTEDKIGAQIFNLDTKSMYVYVPVSETSEDAYASFKCKSILPLPLKSWMDEHSMDEIRNDPKIFMNMVQDGNFRFICDGLVTVLEVFCMRNRRDVLVKKYDEIGVVDDSYETTTKDRRLCKSMFNENY